MLAPPRASGAGHKTRPHPLTGCGAQTSAQVVCVTEAVSHLGLALTRVPHLLSRCDRRYSDTPSKLARFPRIWMWMSASMRFAVDAWRCRLGRHSHPPNPGRAETRPFPSGDGETQCSKIRSNRLSKLACTSFLRGGLGGFQLRASTSTAYLKIRLVWCARWASKGSCLAYPFTILRSQ